MDGTSRILPCFPQFLSVVVAFSDNLCFNDLLVTLVMNLSAAYYLALYIWMFLLLRRSYKENDEGSLSIFDRVPRCLLKENMYLIEEIPHSAGSSTIIFPCDVSGTSHFCVKIVHLCHEPIHDTTSIEKCTRAILQGLAFNRKYAPGVYWGIAAVKLNKEEGTIWLGPLIREPEMHKLDRYTQYALIMKRLPKEWWLDHQLLPCRLGQISGMNFLARNIARLHRQFATSASELGDSKVILSKLEENICLFNQSIDQLFLQRRYSIGSECFEDIAGYQSIGPAMRQAYEALQKEFDRRASTGHVKRCHGDLKAANLWVCPRSGFMKLFGTTPQRLFALDCIDFNRPDFYYIDTFSDVAFLAIDVEMFLSRFELEAEKESRRGLKLAHYFLLSYLNLMGEQGELVWPLLEYYMTEKAMVCTCVKVLFDGQPESGWGYLHIAKVHMRRLQSLLTSYADRSSFLRDSLCS